MHSPIKVLLVEDDDVFASVVKSILLAQSVYCTSWAKSLSEAITLLKQQSFDVVLLDLSLPDSSGLHTIQRVLSVSPSVAIVVMTGTKDEATGFKAVQHGVQDYLLKGELQIHQITRAVRYSIERKRAENKIHQLNAMLEERVAECTQIAIAREKESQERQTLEREILKISEREQCRLGQDLHDGLGQQLAGLALLGKVLASRLEGEMHPLAGSALLLAERTTKTIATARGLAKGLYPVELSRHGLLMALEDLANTVTEQFEISCEIKYSSAPLALEQEFEIHVYRIIQESISNAIRHGRARDIQVVFEHGAQSQTISISDNGVGFSRSTSAKVPFGMGLQIMNYRARMIGAQFEVEKPESGGCKVVLHLPTAFGIEPTVKQTTD